MTLPNTGQNSTRPKFLQLADVVIEQIEKGKLKQDDRLPSVNEIIKNMKMSRETALKGLNYLSEQGIIRAVFRKGYYVQRTDVRLGLRIFFMLDKMTTFKDELYHAFYDTLIEYGEIDVYFHHHNFRLFQQLIENNLQNYTHFVIVTYLKGDVGAVLQKIPSDKLIILDALEKSMGEEYASVYQDFENDIYRSLKEAYELLQQYDCLTLVAPSTLFHLARARKGFLRFCKEHHFKHQEVDGIDITNFHQNNVYITLAAYDIDEVKIIKLTHEKGWQLGREVGLISYNDTPVKEVLEGGITVITTDFASMGKKAAEMIISGKKKKVANTTKLIIRKSL
ncbi:DNA-binding transcriptional regulator YhcF (GntR family) [Catalinimonas alkaloidigena]|uniref:GntR family transcriptional regulator n=1 Tax=Catalinimonas alkaloidigena TaxID=1075417 RepID=UPI00240679D0|nr:substrate-binding domain-containing protein [Catalinimonas alkaloidigena]MDF9795427.1 DNA-binding transcriptional regulator YhcF (GntR family) [Catalinimonas alkaloidigena]